MDAVAAQGAREEDAPLLQWSHGSKAVDALYLCDIYPVERY